MSETSDTNGTAHNPRYTFANTYVQAERRSAPARTTTSMIAVMADQMRMNVVARGVDWRMRSALGVPPKLMAIAKASAKGRTSQNGAAMLHARPKPNQAIAAYRIVGRHGPFTSGLSSDRLIAIAQIRGAHRSSRRPAPDIGDDHPAGERDADSSERDGRRTDPAWNVTGADQHDAERDQPEQQHNDHGGVALVPASKRRKQHEHVDRRGAHGPRPYEVGRHVGARVKRWWLGGRIFAEVDDGGQGVPRRRDLPEGRGDAPHEAEAEPRDDRRTNRSAPRVGHQRIIVPRLVPIDDVHAAAERARSYVQRTPLQPSDGALLPPERLK